MRVLPRELPPDLGTTAELRVHQQLVDLDLAGVALHSLLLPEHDYKLTAEIDFLIILEHALLAVEVKGGGVSCRDGLWTYSDRQGHHRTSREGPFQQVTTAMFALRSRLQERLGAKTMGDVALGFLVITPDVDLPASVEWAEECYLGRARFGRPDGMRSALLECARHWSARQRDTRPIGSDLRQTLLNTLRPDFDRSPGLSARATRLDASYDRLTADQYEKLDLILDEPRVLCSGGAGTGKTFLAADVARRQARQGRRVLFTCRSRVLAEYVRSRLQGLPVEVSAFEDLSVPTGSSAYDYLVVDEAQDVMNVEHLAVLDELLDGGLEGGRWTMFLDPNGQARLYDSFDPDALTMLRGHGAVPATLRTNCRNTREIAFQTRALTGADTGVAAAGSGPEVEFVTCNSAEDETARLSAHLRALRDQDVPDADITLLSLRGEWEHSSAASLREARKGRIRVLDHTWAGKWPGDTLTWATPELIKGLENRFICVIDVGELPPEQVDHLYVALSRARAGLWLALDPAAVESVKSLYMQHAKVAAEALGGKAQ